MKLTEAYDELRGNRAVVCEACGCRYHPLVGECPACLAEEQYDDEAFRSGERAIPVTIGVERAADEPGE